MTLVAGQESLAAVAPEPAGTLEVAVLRRMDAFGLRGAGVEAWDPRSGQVLGSAISSGGIARLIGLPRTPVLLRASWEPFCPGDPSLVPSWSGQARDHPFASELAPLPDEDVTGPVSTLRLPPDGDGDAMDDVWELLSGLDADRADGGEDPDGDGVDNLTEYRTYSDPLLPEGATAGCSLSRVTPTCAASRLFAFVALLVTLVVGGRRRRYHPPPRGPAGSHTQWRSR